MIYFHFQNFTYLLVLGKFWSKKIFSSHLIFFNLIIKFFNRSLDNFYSLFCSLIIFIWKIFLSHHIRLFIFYLVLRSMKLTNFFYLGVRCFNLFLPRMISWKPILIFLKFRFCIKNFNFIVTLWLIISYIYMKLCVCLCMSAYNI